MLQIIGGFPFTTDIVFISATNSESSRVEKHVNSLTGFYHFWIVFLFILKLWCVYLCAFMKRENKLVHFFELLMLTDNMGIYTTVLLMCVH